MRKLRALLTTYREAGGAQPVVLLHDEAHGAPLIDALARHGDGLPAQRAAARRQRGDAGRARGDRRGVRLWRGGGALPAARQAAPRRRPGLRRTHRAGRADPRRPRLRRRPRRDDRDRRSGCARRGAARDRAARRRAPRPASFLPVGGKRDVLRLALRELHRAAPAPVDVVALPAGAPFGAVEINVEGCTLCLACVSACPTGALLRRSRAADAALRRGRLRAVRAVQGDLPGEGDHAAAAARFPRRHRDARACSRRRSRSTASAAASRSASRARSSASPPSSKASTGCSRARRSGSTCIKMCEDCRVVVDHRAGLRSLRRAAAPEGAHHRGLSARARRAGARQQDRDLSGAA